MKKLYKNNVNNYHKKNVRNNFLIDTQTRKDLSLNDFYIKFNNTKTSYGDQIFYHKINSQTNDLTEIKKTIADLEYLSNNKSESSLINKLLNKIGKQNRGNIVNDMWDGLNYRPRFLNLIPFWIMLGPLIVILLYLILGNVGLWGIIGLIVINLIIYLNTNLKINSASGSMNYLIKTIIVLQKLRKIDYFKELITYSKKLNRITKFKIFLQDGIGLSIIGNDLAAAVLDYMRIFFCGELFAYYKIYSYVNANTIDIRKIIENIGYIDFIVNNSEIMTNNVTSYSIFSNKENINFKSLHHPLIDNCSTYNFDISDSIIITGMNMAGKSTFMKSVGINQILAMSFGFTFSEQFLTNKYYVISSMKIEDDLFNKKSKYYMEAERLLMIQNLLKEKELLCLIDEILTGTNTVDRIDASIGILNNYIRNKSSIILAATHDKEIAETLYPAYLNYYFDGTMKNKEILYDFKIKKGIVSSKNALQLLEEIGLEVLSK